MGIKTRIILSLLGIHLLTCYTTCQKHCTDVNYNFAITSRILSDMDSVLIGDTIWMDVNTPVRLKELNNNQEVDFAGAENLGINLQFLQLGKGSTQDPGTTPAALSFDEKLITGKKIANEKFADVAKNYLFNEEGNRYYFKVGFIPKEKGDYMISLGTTSNVYRRNQRCENANFSITFADTDQHLYLYQESRPGLEIDPYDQSHSYCVRVK